MMLPEFAPAPAMAATGIITKGLAYHYRDELAKGKRRCGGVLTDEDIEMRMAALQARAETLGAVYRVRELRALEDLKSKVFARMDALRNQAATNHAEAMQAAAQRHDEAQERIAVVHAKLDGMAAKGVAFMHALDTGSLPPRPEGQTDEERLRFLRARAEAPGGQRDPCAGAR